MVAHAPGAIAARAPGSVMAYFFRETARPQRARLACLFGLMASIGACSGGSTETRRYENVGDIALTPGDLAMTVSVLFDNCLSGCNENVASCSARVADGSVIIETLLEVTTRDDVAECPTVCVQATATCELQNPPSGTYAIHSGLRSEQVELPVSAPTQIIGDGVYNPG